MVDKGCTELFTMSFVVCRDVFLGHNMVPVSVFCRTADGNGTQVAGGMPVAAAPAKSSARVVELPRRNVSKRKDVPAAPT